MNQFIILAFSACLASNPAHCEDRELVYSAHDVTLMQCVTQGQWALAEWSKTHPKWKVGRHTCLLGEDRELGA